MCEVSRSNAEFLHTTTKIRFSYQHFEISLNRCGNRTVTKAYHVCCKPCAKSLRCCAKCLTSADIVQIEPAEPTPQEEVQLKVEMDRLIKTLSERKRRTFLRFMKKGKEAEGGETDPTENEGAVGTEKKRTFVPHVREDLLSKIEALKLAGDNEDDDGDFSFDESDFGSDFDGDDDDDDDDEDEQ